MFNSIEQFTSVFEKESGNTIKLLERLTDESLTKPDHKDVRTLGRAAWHVVTTYPEMCSRFGIPMSGPTEKDPIPSTAKQITDAYRTVSGAVLKAVKTWSDEDLQTEDDMYSQTWKRGLSLWVFLVHEIHHRGQLTVLMRLAGLAVTGLYGPAREEWTQYGMSAPEV